MEFLKQLYNPEGLRQLIQAGGYLLVAAIVFAETGLLAGFFLPGDSLLFVAGFTVGLGVLRPPAPLPQDPVTGMLLLSAMLMAAAFAGNCTGYWVGAKAGRRLFERPNSRFFKKELLVKTEEFYERHGGKTLILAEFIPFARTFAPVVAGIAALPFRRFIAFNALGVFIWINSMTLLGFFLGQNEWVKRNIEKAIVLVILLSISPAIVHLIKARRGHGAKEPVGSEE
jgi:membrane-associated protein